MCKIIHSCVLLTLLSVLPSMAQQLSLPSVDGVTAFYRMGRLSGPWRATATAPCTNAISSFPLCGWGFETVHILFDSDKHNTVEGGDGHNEHGWDIDTGTTNKKHTPWGAELDVGYDFLNLNARSQDGAYEIRGSVQTLPSITLYVSRDIGTRTSAYVGLGTGLVTFKNVRAYDASGRIYGVGGDTWGFTPSIGILHDLQEATDVRPGWAILFETSYEVHDFPSITYSLPSDIKTLPSELPRNISGGGVVLNVGIEITFRKKSDKK